MRKHGKILGLFCLITVFVLLVSCLNVLAADNEEPKATLMFFSDYQMGTNIQPTAAVTQISAAISAEGKNVTHVIGCGDYTNISGYSNYNAPEYDTFLSIHKIKNITKTAFGNDLNYSFIQGNHDPFLEEYSDRHCMDKTGAYDYGDYTVYLINTQSDYPWGQGVTASGDIIRNTAAKLEKFLSGRIEAGDARPVFIVTHVPLHFSGRASQIYAVGDNVYAEYLFDVINKAAEKLNIVFFYGHNHSKGFDNYIGNGSVYMPIGSEILIPDASSVQTTFNSTTLAFNTYTNNYLTKTLNFVYMNAGYVGYIDNPESEENGALTSTVVEIYSDRLVLSRFDCEGLHELSGTGYFNTNELYPDSLVFNIENTDILSKSIESPQNCLLKTEVIPDIPEYILGDLNGDGDITSIDANLLKKTIAGTIVLDNLEIMSADLNCDGDITSIDANLMTKYISGAITEF